MVELGQTELRLFGAVKGNIIFASNIIPPRDFARDEAMLSHTVEEERVGNIDTNAIT